MVEIERPDGTVEAVPRAKAKRAETMNTSWLRDYGGLMRLSFPFGFALCMRI